MSNVANLKSLLNATKDYIISILFPVFLDNNTFGDANIYELNLLIKYLLIMTPDQIFPYIKGLYVLALLPSPLSSRSAPCSRRCPETARFTTFWFCC